MANEITMSLPSGAGKTRIMGEVVQSAFNNGAKRVIYVSHAKQAGEQFRANLPKHLRACVTVRCAHNVRWMAPSSNDCVIVDNTRALQIMDQWRDTFNSVVIHVKTDLGAKHPRLIF